MIPEGFLSRMRRLLGDAFPAFLEALEAPAQRAIRVNSQKISPEDFLGKTSFSLKSIPYARDGFYLEGEERVGSHPHHHAGAFYSQDPGSMSTVCALPEMAGAKVLDACASPGGKSSQLACRIGKGGMLVSNEINGPRCKVLGGNLERQGFRNVIVTNTDSETLGKWYSGFFDLVLVDAPCSGEGMFRKYEVATEEWSEEGVLACARRQREILQNLASAVAPGGYLLYSTCTFSMEENEETVADFLQKHPDYTVIPVADAVRRVTAEGIPCEGLPLENAACTRRFYPHIAPGEGQFLALLRRLPEASSGKGICFRDSAEPLSGKELEIVRHFLKEVLGEMPTLRLFRIGDRVFLGDAPVPPKQVFSPGVAVGTLQKGRLEPHHHLFTAFGAEMVKTLDFPANAPEIAAYLRGETFSCDPSKSGWAAVLVDGVPLGGVKLVGGTAKNHYPKGLRQR